MPLTPYFSNRVAGKTVSLWSLLCGALALTMTLSVSTAAEGRMFKNSGAGKVHFSNPREPLLSFGGQLNSVYWLGQDAYDYMDGWYTRTVPESVDSRIHYSNFHISREGGNDIDNSAATAYFNWNNDVAIDSLILHEFQQSLVDYTNLLLNGGIAREPDSHEDVLSKKGPEIDKAFYGLEGNVFYVSESGNDNNNGREENLPFKTLQHASDLAEPGDIVYVMDGLYQNGKDEDILGIKQSGTQSNWIMYAALPGHKPKLKVKAGDAISIHGAEYLIIDGFEIEGNNPAVILEYALAEQNSLFNNITNSSGVSIHPDWNTTNYSHHVIVRNCHVYNFSGSGIASNTADYILIENNTVHHNAYYSPWAMSGISLYKNSNFDDYRGHKMIIRNNISYANRNYVPFFYSHTDLNHRTITDGNGIIVDTNNESIKIVNEEETFIPYLGRTLIENNVSYLNGGKGINIYRSDHIDVINNTTYQNSRTENSIGEINLGEADDINIYNNIVYPQLNDQSISMWATGSSINIDYNLIYNTDSNFFPDANNMIGLDPLFVNIDPQSGQYDFRLKPDSPAIDNAYNQFASIVDSDGVSRPVNKEYDIGAFEFAGQNTVVKNVKRRLKRNTKRRTRMNIR